MPNLFGIHQRGLRFGPDIFIRDFVGDVGDPHTGAISASPDIILLKNKLTTDPQLTFGTENPANVDRVDLGSEAEFGQPNYIYVRIKNRGRSAAVNVKATVYWSQPSTLPNPTTWQLAGSVVIPIVVPGTPAGSYLTVSNEIAWNTVPATGHYCFVGLIDNLADPAPQPVDFLNWNNYQAFIRNNNNVTWRNFNVVNTLRLIRPEDYIVLPWKASGAPDGARKMQLEVVAHLPEGSQVALEGPAEFLKLFHTDSRPTDDGKRLIKVNPNGRHIIGEATFPAEANSDMRFVVTIPKERRRGVFDLYVTQRFEGLEVGRITWRLMGSESEEPYA